MERLCSRSIYFMNVFQWKWGLLLVQNQYEGINSLPYLFLLDKELPLMVQYAPEPHNEIMGQSRLPEVKLADIIGQNTVPRLQEKV